MKSRDEIKNEILENLTSPHLPGIIDMLLEEYATQSASQNNQGEGTTAPSAVQVEALRYSHELRENLVKWLTETFCYIYRDEADIIIDHFQRYASLSAPQDEGWVSVRGIVKDIAELKPYHINPYNLGDERKISDLLDRLIKIVNS